MNRKIWTIEKLFSRVLICKTEKAIWANISELRRRPNELVFQKCTELIKSEFKNEKIIAIQILAQLGLPPRPFVKQSMDIFLKLLKTETDSEIIRTLIYSIGHNSEILKNTQIETLCSYYNHKNLFVRQALAFAIGGLDTRRSIETLIKLSADKTASIRDLATFGLGSIGNRNSSKIREALWLRIKDNDKYTRYEAIYGLAKRNERKVIPQINEELKKFKYESILLEAIEFLKDKSFVPQLRKILVQLKNGKKNEEVESILEIEKCIEYLEKPEL